MNPFMLNALLKTLEEPPKNTLFFLTAERPVLSTIASRCMTFKLAPMSEKAFQDTVSKDPILYQISMGYPLRAAYFEEQNCLALVKDFSTLLEDSTKGCFVMPTSFVPSMLPYKAFWEDWFLLWFRGLCQTQGLDEDKEALCLGILDVIRQHHLLDPKFLFQRIFAMLSEHFSGHARDVS